MTSPARPAAALPAPLRREGMTFAARGGRRGEPVVMVPAEHVTLRAVELPLPSARKRRAAAPFAMEEALAEGPEDVHVAVAPAPVSKDTPNRYIAAAVSRGRMAAWVAALERSGLAGARLVPDALTLPPTPGGWTVGIVGSRALVRREDGTAPGTAFAIPAASLPLLWRAAGEPPFRAFGDALPPGMVPVERIGRPASPVSGGAVFDLRQGAFAAGGEAPSRGWLRAAGIALVAGAAAHAAIDIADARAVQGMAEEARDEARALLSRIAPEARGGGDPVAALARLSAAGRSVREPGFLDILADASAALGRVPVALAVTALSWAREDRALVLDLEIADLPALEQVDAALAAAGLRAETGPASTANGATTARIVIREGGG